MLQGLRIASLLLPGQFSVLGTIANSASLTYAAQGDKIYHHSALMGFTLRYGSEVKKRARELLSNCCMLQHMRSHRKQQTLVQANPDHGKASIISEAKQAECRTAI